MGLEQDDPTVSVEVTINYEDGRELHDVPLTTPIQLSELGSAVADLIKRNTDGSPVSSVVVVVVA